MCAKEDFSGYHNFSRTLAEHNRYAAEYQRELDKYNKFLGSAEQIKYFRLVNDEWSPLTGELSQTLKLKRHTLYNKYDHILKEMYSYQPSEKNRALKVY